MGRNRPTVPGIVSEHNKSKLTATADALKVQHRELDKELLNISHTGVPSSPTTWRLDTDQIGTLCTTLSIFYCTANVNTFFISSHLSWRRSFRFLSKHSLALVHYSSLYHEFFHYFIYLHSFHLIGMEINVVGERHTPTDNTNKRESFQKWVVIDICL